ncbi:hypothetical protein SH580_16970 [Coraliomargarita algicola]|uniref:Uncharacterized protein n=1 Tax=Coraliomargarita algicola TaxID=3092156 RepID=A0ABZ0RI19_9BACT|nr:hypothetical protein [Coraliomargarita sp. J2-16]WPJ95118.1 hypothetical protein SH580_16970 [Coraliomargarita sp. J2-16]
MVADDVERVSIQYFTGDAGKGVPDGRYLVVFEGSLLNSGETAAKPYWKS